MNRPPVRPTLRLKHNSPADHTPPTARPQNAVNAANADHAVRQAPLHQRDLQRIGGLPAVTALFQRDPERVERLFFEPRMAGAVQEFCRVLAAAKKPYRQVSPEELIKVGGSPLHGGVVAVVQPKYPTPLPIPQIPQWAAGGANLILLDGVGNPHNLGAIARSMAFFAFDTLILSNHPEQASLSGAAQRVAEGGLEWVNVYQAGRMADLIPRLRPHYRIIGTALGQHASPMDILSRDDRPVALLFGNEENGLSSDTLSACDEIVTIPGSGRVQSLNVSNSAAILLYQLQSRFCRSATKAR